MNTQKSKPIPGKTATTKSPSKRNKSCVSQDESTRRGSMRNKNCTPQDKSTTRGSQRNKGYATQDEDTKSTLKRSNSFTSKDEDTKSAIVKTIRDSHSKFTEASETFSRRTLIASQNKHILTRSATVKSKIVSTQKESIDTSMKGTIIDSQSEHSTARSASTKSQTRGYRSERSTTRSASTKSQTRGYHSERSTTRSASMKSNIRSHGGESIEAKKATIKNIICGLQNESKTQGQTTKMTTRGSPRKGTVTKDTPSKRKHRGSESGAHCASSDNMNNKPGDVPVKKKEDARTCSVTQEHSQLEEGEIIDGESSPYTSHAGGRKRRRRKYKSRNASTTASTPKKFKDKVEIVDLRPEGYTFRDVKRGHKLIQHRSTGGGRQQTANTPSSINTSSASTCRKTSTVDTCKPDTVKRSKAGEMKRLKVAPGDTCTVDTCKSDTVKRSKAGEMKRLKVAPGDKCAAVALEGEIPSDSHVPGNVSSSEMLPQSGSDMSISSEDSGTGNPQSGSDMSISSEDSGTEDSVPTTEHTDSHVVKEDQGLQGRSDMGNTPITSTAAEPPGSNLNPLAAAFVPRGSSSAVSDLAQHPNTTSTSGLTQMSAHPHNQPWTTNIAQSHFIQQDIRLPLPWSQPVRGPFLQPPVSGLPGSDLWTPTSADLDGESRVQTSTRRIGLCPTADHSCPEIRNSSRCWQAVEHTDVQAGSMEVTVMCYNILSQQLMDRHMYLYDRCREADLEWDTRGAALLTQIIAHNADIVCLQEVEHDDWVQDIRDTLTEHGYTGVYKKQSGDNTHGCAILFKASQFLQLKAVPVEYMKGGILDRHNIGLILLLQPQREVYAGSVQKICVATTHLLFNPRRGDVKLAQLMVLLAEIDKHAYLDDQPDIGQCMQSEHKCCPDSDPSNLKVDFKSEHKCCPDSDPSNLEPFQSGHCPEINEDAGSPCGPALQASAMPRPPRYCPIILCGDFNSEPFCDLYKFITTGYLKYDDCISRLLCGQEEGKWSGTDRLVDRMLLPASLGICESCQYLHVLRERQNTGAAGGGQPLPRVNSGQVWHGMNFKSVYTHFVGQGYRNREISTHHNNCSCTVDYIFYSQSAASGSQSLMPGSERGDSTAAQLDDSPSDLAQGDRNTNVDSVDIQDRGLAAGSADIHKDGETCQHPLELVARYTLLTRNELTRFGYMPNSVFPSDHLCLIAKFVLR